MELRQLKYFVTVAEAGSFSAAATALHMSQPPLSLTIAQLERELGVGLFTRSSRGVRPTAAGNQLLEDAYRILNDVETVTRRLNQHSTGQLGQISVAAVPSLMWNRIPAMLGRYAAEYPDVDVQLHDPGPLEAVEMVLKRTADIAFIVTADNRRLVESFGGSLGFAPCRELELFAVLPPGDDQLSDPIDLHELDGRTLFVPRRTLAVPSLAEILEDALRARDVVPHNMRTVATMPTCFPLIAAGLGAAVLPEPAGSGTPLPHLTIRRIFPPLRHLQVAAVWWRDGGVSPAMEALRRLALEQETPAANGLARLVPPSRADRASSEG